MSRPKYTKPDTNQSRVIKELRELGAVVWDLHDLSTPILDLLVCWRGICLPVEVKSPGGTLTPDQKRSIARLRAVGVEAIVAGSAEEVVAAWPNS